MLIRSLDFIFSLIALCILTPLLLPVILILRFSGEGEIFYKQERVGIRWQAFSLLKFATMMKSSPGIGAGEITLKNDPRVLPFGKILRKSKINELPQILNILLGHISVVGPRPMVPNTFRKYSKEAQRELIKVRPGLTGIGSIVFRDEEQFLEGKNDPRKFYDHCIIPYKNELEIWYVKNQSLIVYMKIIFATACVIVFPKSEIISILFKDLPKKPTYLQN
jgi:lipopolysaccharide/colanic/teichoic acid biosynthesis glycosyltransferase